MISKRDTELNLRLESPKKLLLAFALLAVAIMLVFLAAQHQKNLRLRPDPGAFTAYEVGRAARGEVGSTEPEIITPGDVIKLIVYRGQEECIDGLWRAEELRLKPIPMHTPDSKEISWNPTGIKSSTQTWDDVVQISRPNWPNLSIRNSGPLRPWVQFRLPNDERLVGQKLVMQVHLTGIYPAQGVPRNTFINRRFSVDAEVGFQVATSSEISAYRKYETNWESWKKEADMGLILAITSFALLVVAVIAGTGLLWSAISRVKQD